jgi:hypothetical protein
MISSAIKEINTDDFSDRCKELLGRLGATITIDNIRRAIDTLATFIDGSKSGDVVPFRYGTYATVSFLFNLEPILKFRGLTYKGKVYINGPRFKPSLVSRGELGATIFHEVTHLLGVADDDIEDTYNIEQSFQFTDLIWEYCFPESYYEAHPNAKRPSAHYPRNRD